MCPVSTDVRTGPSDVLDAVKRTWLPMVMLFAVKSVVLVCASSHQHNQVGP